MTTIWAFFLQIRALFFQFLKKGRGDLPSPPSSYAPNIELNIHKAAVKLLI